jgi:hypothetical protein
MIFKTLNSVIPNFNGKWIIKETGEKVEILDDFLIWQNGRTAKFSVEGPTMTSLKWLGKCFTGNHFIIEIMF